MPEFIDDQFLKNIGDLSRAQLNVLMSFVSEEGFVGSSRLSIPLRRRLTHQFIAAMLSCGFPKISPVIQKAYDWLMKSQAPSEVVDTIDWFLVLDKVEAAIRMGDSNDKFCTQAVDLILSRRRSSLHYQLPSASSDANTFNALWCTKILLNYPHMPKCRLAVTETIKAFTKDYENLCPHARDLSFLIYLYSKTYPDIKLSDPIYKKMKTKLLKYNNNGLFDTSKELSPVIIQELNKSGLFPALVSGNENALHWSLISTCYVIENLADLCQRSNSLSSFIVQAIKTIHRILINNQENIELVYPDQYKQIMISARCISAFVKYFPTGFNNYILPTFIEENVRLQREKRQNDQTCNDEPTFTNVIKNWLSIRINDPEYIGGGRSGSKIARIKPVLRIPAETQEGYLDKPVPNIETVIIKYGKPEDLEQERTNYSCIPPEFRNMFASIPKTGYLEQRTGKVVEYLLIEDLLGFSTFEEFITHCPTGNLPQFISKFCDFLKSFYAIPIGAEDTRGLIRRLYTAQMHKSIELIHEIKTRIVGLDSSDFEFMQNIITIIQNSNSLENFRPTPMHGDLNSRNIMVRGKFSAISELRFRFIDLNKFSRTGDFAYDLGEFLVDMETVTKQMDSGSQSNTLSGQFESSFLKLLTDKPDEFFQVRLNLGKARSLLKILDLKANQALQLLGTNPINDSQAKLIFKDQIMDKLSAAYRYISDSVQIMSSLKER